jgi:hypothetical protein
MPGCPHGLAGAPFPETAQAQSKTTGYERGVARRSKPPPNALQRSSGEEPCVFIDLGEFRDNAKRG